MIVLENVFARSRRGFAGGRSARGSSLANVSFTWERGLLVVLGHEASGTTALLEVLAGRLNVQKGHVHVNGKSPAEARAQVAYVPRNAGVWRDALAPSLPVEAVFALASRFRGETPKPARSRLETLGLESLAPRPLGSLSAGEARAVALVIAITSEANVLLIDEPFADLGPSAAFVATGKLWEQLRARAASGATVVVTTSSVREATSLADQLALMANGTFEHLAPARAHTLAFSQGASLRVVVAASKDVTALLVAALATDAAVASLATSAFPHAAQAEGETLSAMAIDLTGADILALARAVQTAIAKERVPVFRIEPGVLPLPLVRATPYAATMALKQVLSLTPPAAPQP